MYTCISASKYQQAGGWRSGKGLEPFRHPDSREPYPGRSRNHGQNTAFKKEVRQAKREISQRKVMNLVVPHHTSVKPIKDA